MSNQETQRQLILERLADHLLAAGLQGARLRPMAIAAGTSDRMLLYYFADKNELLSETLSLVAQRLLRLLEQSKAEPMPFPSLLLHLARMLKNPAIRPYLRLWLELAAMAGRNLEPFRSVSRQIGDGFLDWITDGLQGRSNADRRAKAALLFATLEGLVLLDSIGCESTIKSALKVIPRMN